MFPRKDRLGAYRTVFLANDAGLVHGPGKASASIHESCPQPDGTAWGKIVLALFFVHGDGPYGSRGTDMSTSNAVVLTTAGAGPEV